MCGEQYKIMDFFVRFKGSPPRVRGTDWRWPRWIWIFRITPACAGNRWSCRRPWWTRWDHPRVCGEQYLLEMKTWVGEGSPPRVRGTAPSPPARCLRKRITPACAGNSALPPVSAMAAWDHPRVCGEQTKKSPSFLHSFLSDQENSFSLKYNCSISSQSFCARWTSLQGSSKCFAKVDS